MQEKFSSDKTSNVKVSITVLFNAQGTFKLILIFREGETVDVTVLDLYDFF